MPAAVNLLDITKTRLRLKSDAFDDELTMHIDTGKTRLILAGINPDIVEAADDQIIVNTLSAFACSQFGIDNPESGRFFRIFNSFMTVLSLCEEYKEQKSG